MSESALPVAAPMGVRGQHGGARRSPRSRWHGWPDVLADTDPGFNRLLLALQTVITIGVALAAEWAFVHATGALQVSVPPASPAAQVAALGAMNHAILVIAMMLGAIIAMLGSFTATTELDLPAEALVRLVYGRLDRDHTPPGAGPAPLLDELRGVYPGF